MRRQSRRRVLTATGTILATALAGCGGGAPLPGDDDAVSYDRAALTALAAQSPPAPPTAFPLSIPSNAFDRHRSRIRALLDAVPVSPNLPNGALSAKLAERRSEVAERLRATAGDEATQSGETGSEYLPDLATPRERLDDLRSIRADAAEINAAYRAATGRLDRGALRSRQRALRSELYDFLSSWTYDGASPLEALIVHRHLEGLIERVRMSLREHTSVPDRPTDAVFEAGEVAASVEHARAALADAALLRGAYRESIAEPTSYRETIQAAAERLGEQYEITAAHTDIHAYADRDEPPFERSIEGTPAGVLYRRALERVDERVLEERSVDRQPASRSLRVAIGLAAIHTFRTVVTEIEAGKYGVPDSVAPIAQARADAIDALRMVWGGEPRALRLELDWPATETVRAAMSRLHEEVSESDDREISKYTVSETYGGLLYAYHYATYVPPAADHLLSVLRGN
ncbi:MAG: hypothetical protein ABEK02_08650 [Haloquadratum sp.]